MTIKAKTPSKDSSGGVVANYTVTQENVPCMFQPTTAQVQLLYAQRKQVVTGTAYTNQSVTVHNGDLVTIGTNDYVVVGIRQAVTMRPMTAIDLTVYLS